MTNILPLLQENRERFSLLRMVGELGDSTKTEVYVVGGYVRDLLMGRPLTDIDLVVVGNGIEFARKVAESLRVKRIVSYEEFGTASIPYRGEQIEVASARREVYKPDSRNPKVTYTDLEEDLCRRDFTMNAVAISLMKKNRGELIDPYGGIHDLRRKIIQTPLNPDTTFSDDPLRMMRAIRFAAQLEFQIERAVIESIRRQAKRIRIVSAERITAEFYKILVANRPSIGLELLQHVGLMEMVFPEVAAMYGLEQSAEWHHKDIFYHTLQVVDNMARMTDKADLRFAALVHDIAKPVTRRYHEKNGWTFHGHDAVGARILEKVSRRMRLSNRTREYIQKLTLLHLRPISIAKEEVTDSAVRRLMISAGDDLDDLMMLCRADITSRNPRLIRKYLGNFDHVEKLMHDVQQRDALRAFQSPVRGDLIMKECGIEPGPLVGKIKKAIEEAILDGKIENSFDAAYQFFLQIKDEYVGATKRAL